MNFGELPVAEAEGAILAHAVRAGDTLLKKGRVLDAGDIARLRAAGLRSVVAARLEEGDVHEDRAARRLAEALADPGLRLGTAATGRVNVYAEEDGILVVDRERIDRINLLDESLTVATLAGFVAVEPGQMVATIKVIPFSAPGHPLSVAERMALPAGAGAGIRVAPWIARRTGLIQTRLPSTREKVLDKTATTTADRLRRYGAGLSRERRCGHTVPTVAGELRSMVAGGHDLVLIAGASAITDRRDVLPAAVEAAGGEIVHFGMPVDPGNLLLVARLGDAWVLGLPGCARSPRENGFDWVLQRLMAGIAVGARDITAMGVGGLLSEIPSRPQPRRGSDPGNAPGNQPGSRPRASMTPRIAAIVLAAGQSRRMGGINKLLASVGGKAMVRHAVDAALDSGVAETVVVTGHESDAVEAALVGSGARFVHNPDFAAGLSTSVAAGIGALGPVIDAALIILGDMPYVTGAHLRRLIDAYAPLEGRAIVVPTVAGKRGNPVLWDRRFFGAMRGLSGDVGARHLIGEHGDLVHEVALDDDALALDIDTPEELRAAAGKETA
ncbi:MAG: molybdopterin-binding/glycosyltransferase family 2 protein [Azospirillaceae bacterium]